MRYFKNSELIKTYNVSDKAVRNWIEGAQQGKFKLELIEEGKKIYIADSLNNGFVLEKLAERGKKFRNRRNYKVLSPNPKFYKLFNVEQQIDIINNLDKYREIPQHYRYFGDGGIYWDAYLHKLYTAASNNILSTTTQLLQFDWDYLCSLLDDYAYVNVVDIGVGNGLAAKELLGKLHSTGKLKKYIGIDCSQTLLDITKQNLKTWFGDSIEVKTHAKDITYERFAEVVAKESYRNTDQASTFTIFLFLGATIGNLKEPSQVLRVIRDSMGKDDILITSDKLDSERTRRFFDFNIVRDVSLLSQRNRLLLDLLSIEDSFYEVEQFFDEQHSSRFIQARLKVEISITFKIGSAQKTISIHKGEPILIFRMWEWYDQELAGLYKKAGFINIRMSKTPDQDYVLLISKVDTQRPTSYS
jgi:uncharacterized SAM-dependent methyltransferase